MCINRVDAIFATEVKDETTDARPTSISVCSTKGCDKQADRWIAICDSCIRKFLGGLKVQTVNIEETKSKVLSLDDERFSAHIKSILDKIEDVRGQSAPGDLSLLAYTMMDELVNSHLRETILIKQLKEDSTKLREWLVWALAQIDANYNETGKIEFAELIVYKAAKKFLEK